ncbi:MAG: hypothetical protein R3E90_07230 [Marinicella sp.]
MKELDMEKLLVIKNIIIILVVTFMSLDSTAQVSIEPQNPVAGEPVQLYYQGCEPPYPHVDSGELFYTERSDGLVQFVGFFTFSLPLCPIWYEEYYDLGTFDEGDYELEVYLFLGIEPLPINLDQRTPNEIISFSVSGAPEPVNVNLFSKISLSFLLLLILTSTFIIQRKNHHEINPNLNS